MERQMTVTFYAGCLKDEILEPAVDFHTAPSFSNGNALLVLEMLGIDPGESYAGSMEIDPALGIMRGWLRAHINRPSAALAARVKRSAGHATIVDCGVEDGYVNRRVHEIAIMLAAGKVAGATHFCWG